MQFMGVRYVTEQSSAEWDNTGILNSGQLSLLLYSGNLENE
jgi:hypothetical protein